MVPEGQPTAPIMIVGEFPDEHSARTQRAFNSIVGYELDRILTQSGISKSSCFFTYLIRERPPMGEISNFIPRSKKEITSVHSLLQGRHADRRVHDGATLLEREIQMVKPQVILALGETVLWYLCNQQGIAKWRGSMLYSSNHRIKTIPTYSIEAVIRDWSLRGTVIADCKRAAKYAIGGSTYPKPAWNFIIRPTFKVVLECLQGILDRLALEPRRLSFDLETRAGHIACAGLSWTLNDAICIPFMCMEQPKGYWALDQEVQIIWLIRQVLTHKNALIVGQNILYDAQYTWKHWHFVPNVVQDCMISQHTLFSDLPKSLAYQASIYCNYYKFWKEEGKWI